MKFYHGTTPEIWKDIKVEGCLFGMRSAPSRCTYLAVDKGEAMQYGGVLLEVDYDPRINISANNYVEGCWQFRVYEPIPLRSCRRITTPRSAPRC